MTTTFPVRLFGGRDLGVTYDSTAGTLTIANASISISSLSAALQLQWANAVASTIPAGKAPAAGDNLQQAVGAILDAQPAWRGSIQAALVGYVG